MSGADIGRSAVSLISDTRWRLQNEITRVKLDLLKWLVPLMFAQVAAIAALVKLL
jgi:hypothetical protein